MKKMDDKGFTLVELLIAVTILAIVVVPMFNSIVSAFHINARSRDALRTTTLAQNEMEIFEKETIESLSNPAGYAYSASNPTGYQVTGPDTDGIYVFERRGVVNNTGKAYDIRITLDPQKTDASDRYYTQNTTALLAMNTISNRDSGAYVQEVRTESSTSDQDSLAYLHFVNNLTTLAQLVGIYTTDFFESMLNRTITVDIEKYTAAGETYTRASVNYDYTYDYPNVVRDDAKVYNVNSIIFDNSQSLDAYGNPIELKSIYLFYAPRYLAGSNGLAQKEKIIINNKDGLPIDIYLIRQDILNAANTVETVPATYKPSITISDVITSGKTAGKYHTNLNFGTGSAPGSVIKLELLDENGSASGKIGSDAFQAMGLVSLDATEYKDRIYSMKVEVFDEGANFNTDSPLTTITGTKLE